MTGLTIQEMLGHLATLQKRPELSKTVFALLGEELERCMKDSDTFYYILREDFDRDDAVFNVLKNYVDAVNKALKGVQLKNIERVKQGLQYMQRLMPVLDEYLGHANKKDFVRQFQ